MLTQPLNHTERAEQSPNKTNCCHAEPDYTGRSQNFELKQKKKPCPQQRRAGLQRCLDACICTNTHEETHVAAEIEDNGVAALGSDGKKPQTP